MTCSVVAELVELIGETAAGLDETAAGAAAGATAGEICDDIREVLPLQRVSGLRTRVRGSQRPKRSKRPLREQENAA